MTLFKSISLLSTAAWMLSSSALAEVLPDHTALLNIPVGSTVEVLKDISFGADGVSIVPYRNRKRSLVSALSLFPFRHELKKGTRLEIKEISSMASGGIQLVLSAPGVTGFYMITEGLPLRHPYRAPGTPEEVELHSKEYTIESLRHAFGWAIWVNAPDAEKGRLVE